MCCRRRWSGRDARSQEEAAAGRDDRRRAGGDAGAGSVFLQPLWIRLPSPGQPHTAPRGTPEPDNLSTLSSYLKPQDGFTSPHAAQTQPAVAEEYRQASNLKKGIELIEKF